ncbi:MULTISPECIES: TSCPD domain-containing protein [Aeromonas]|uniref:ribonucleoside-diphosphate reductase n=1 Tax=Aeromonas lusitana TaxID=931529 RepID=A0A2M8H6X8_9GAMM|nr:NrdJb [Aeromonas lusitana]PJC92328.1 NrdJb [Aeromonas lusitana]
MVKKIDRKIVAYKVQTRDEPQEAPAPQDDVVQMHETVLRPERLMGTTYKLKTPEHVSEHSLFITINDIILNEGTVHESRRPFEIFINSKSLEHYQWIVALTRIISAVFRKGGDVTFLVEELRSVFDPKGGYWNKGKYVPSLIAEIGNVIETHLTEIGMLKAPGLDEHQQAFLAEKKAQLQSEQEEAAQSAGSGFPANAALCYKCHTKALVLKDGCMTCLNCGDSKCG